MTTTTIKSILHNKSPLAVFLTYRKNPIAFFYHIQQKFGPYCRFKMGPYSIVFVAGDTGVDEVLKNHHKNFIKGRTTQKLRAILGNGLITNEGKSWTKQNKILRPSFSEKNLTFLYKIVENKSDQHFLRIRESIQKDPDQKIHLLEEMNSLSISIITEVLFQDSLSTEELYHFTRGVKALLEITVQRTRSVIPLPLWIPTRSHRIYRQFIHTFKNLVQQKIEQRLLTLQDSSESIEDISKHLLDHFIIAHLINKNTNQLERKDIFSIKNLHFDQLVDELITLLMAGHETMTNGLSWTLIQLSLNPKYLEDIFNSSETEGPGMAQWCFMESLRLYPPVWIFTRQAKVDTSTLIGEIKKNEMIVLAPLYLHRREEYFSKADQFFPERMQGREKELMLSSQWIPFGHGPRTCLGVHFSFIEANIILKKFSQNFKFSTKNNEDLKTCSGTNDKILQCQAGITLSPTVLVEQYLEIRS